MLHRKQHRVLKLVTVLIFVLMLLFMLSCTSPRTAPAGRKEAIRKAFAMSVHAGQELEYERRHRPIWPELEDTLKKHGVVTYSIFLDRDTRQLFAYVEFENQAQWDAVAKTDVCRRWWAYMKDIMPSNTDNSPVSKELKEVFHMKQ